MVIFTTKLSKNKLIGIVCAAAALLILVILLANRTSAADIVETAATVKQKLETPESRVEYLKNLGYDVDEAFVRSQEVLIPKEFSEVYQQYNALQQSQGFDLEKYKGKTVMQYVYLVENYPEENSDPVYATLLIYKNKLIGGDISRGGAEGFLRPLLGT